MAPAGDPPRPSSVDERIAEWAEDAATEAAAVRAIPRQVEARSFLLVREGDAASIVDLAPGMELVVGRAPDAGVRVQDRQVSRAHAHIRCQGPAVLVRDLGSRNGTLVNGQLLANAERAVVAGDQITVGGCTMVLATLSGAREPAAPPDVGGDDELAAADPEMAVLLESARKVARTQTSVLLLGETGVGKDVFARRIHDGSPRAAGPFIRVNCAALPETLLESELFGHEKGAFTGADRRKIGYFEAAVGGTLFIDEIGELPLPAQVKLLNVLEARAVTRVGGTQALPVDVRVLSATNRDLQAEIAAGRFRSDLYYRISPFSLAIPPLRARPRQLVALADHFVRTLSGQKAAPPLGQDVVDLLLRYPWPGNVRELRNAVEHALVMADGAPLQVDHFSREVRGGVAPPPTNLKDTMAHDERQRIEAALAAEGGNQTRAAERLGMPRRTLVHKLARYRKGE